MFTFSTLAFYLFCRVLYNFTYDLPCSASTAGLVTAWEAADCATGCGSPPATRSMSVDSTPDRCRALAEWQINERNKHNITQRKHASDVCQKINGRGQAELIQGCIHSTKLLNTQVYPSSAFQLQQWLSDLFQEFYQFLPQANCHVWNSWLWKMVTEIQLVQSSLKMAGPSRKINGAGRAGPRK